MIQLIFYFTLFIQITHSEIVTGDECGETCHWEYNTETNHLIISGTGEMKDVVSQLPDYGKYISVVVSVEIKEGITVVGSYSFLNAKQLQTVSLPSTLLKINGGAFQNCQSLKSINIPQNVVSIGDEVFWGASSLTSLSIPSSVIMLPSSFCKECVKLSEVIFNEGLIVISEQAFENCNSLKSITIPSSVGYIGTSSFFNCSSLSSITIHSGVKELPNEFCKNCVSLTEIVLPQSVVKIGEYAFDGCEKLTAIQSYSLTSIANTSFVGCSQLKSFQYHGSEEPECYEDVFESSKNINVIEVYTNYTATTFCGKQIDKKIELPKIEEQKKPMTRRTVGFIIADVTVFLFVIATLVIVTAITYIVSRKVAKDKVLSVLGANNDYQNNVTV